VSPTRRRGTWVQDPPTTHGEQPLALGDANMQDRGLGFGVLKHGNDVGKNNAKWSEVALPAGIAAGSEIEIDVPHSLGATPSFCKLYEWENTTTPGTHLAARPVSKSKWTGSTCRVAVHIIAGTSTDCTARFMVGGE
jgi:hypothetical protein